MGAGDGGRRRRRGLDRQPGHAWLDAIFPAFFLGLLVNEIRRPGAPVVCAIGAVIALVLTPVAPAGVPIIAASLAVVVGIARVIPMLAPALLAALVIAETFGGPGRSLVFDARAGGLAVAGVALWRRAPLYVVVVAAAAATALVRTLG